MEANSKSYTIVGVPTPLHRARVSWQAGKVYDGQKEFKEAIRYSLKQQHGGDELFKGPLKVSFVFYFRSSRAKSFYHTYVPDLSNLIKMVEDIGTGILYDDDRQIAEINAIKCYSSSSRTEFTITKLAKGESDGDDTVPKPTKY